MKLGRWHKSALAYLQNKLLDHSLSKSSIVSGQQEWAKLKKIISELFQYFFFMDRRVLTGHISLVLTRRKLRSDGVTGCNLMERLFLNFWKLGIVISIKCKKKLRYGLATKEIVL